MILKLSIASHIVVHDFNVLHIIGKLKKKLFFCKDLDLILYYQKVISLQLQPNNSGLITKKLVSRGIEPQTSVITAAWP